jgi:hypothetical protein
MDIIIEKLAELDVESRAQKEFWEAEMLRDEEERLDREVVKVMVHCQKKTWKIPCSATCDSDAKANDTDFSVLIYYFNEMDFSVGRRKIPCEDANFPRQL